MQVMERDRINVALQAEALRLLASLFRRPDGSLTVSIDALLSVYADEPAAVASLETMRNSLEAGDLTPLLVDYTQLFIGSFEMTAPPYASYYLSPSPAVGRGCHPGDSKLLCEAEPDPGCSREDACRLHWVYVRVCLSSGVRILANGRRRPSERGGFVLRKISFGVGPDIFPSHEG